MMYLMVLNSIDVTFIHLATGRAFLSGSTRGDSRHKLTVNYKEHSVC